MKHFSLHAKKIYQTMYHHPVYYNIDRITDDLISRNVSICRDEVYKLVTRGATGEQAAMIAFLLDLPVPDGFKMPKKSAKPFPAKKSNYIGVSRTGNKWRADICINGMQIYLGAGDEIEMARLYNDAAAQVGRKLNCIPAPKSPYKGVYFDNGIWSAQIRIEGETRYIGHFKDDKEAAIAWNKVAAPLGRKLNEVSV